MSEQPIIDSVPGAEPVQAAAPSKQPVVIDNPGPQTLRTAIGSPHAPIYGPNVQGGPVSAEASPVQLAVGETAVADSGLIDSVPGMEPAETTEPTRGVVELDNPGPQTRRTAIGSPDAPVYGPNVHGGPAAQ